jgi:hypothetical protein
MRQRFLGVARLSFSGLGAMTKQKEMPAAKFVLDNFLEEIDQISKSSHVPKAHFGLKEIERYPRAKEALEGIIMRLMERNGLVVYSHRHPLVTGVSPNIYGEEAGLGGYPRWRIRTKYIRPAVRVLLERALQILVHMSPKDEMLTDNTRQLQTLASSLLTLSDKADKTFKSNVTKKRIAKWFVYSNEPNQERIFRLVAEMAWVGETINTICAETRLIKTRIDSPNPQVRFALYIVDWIDRLTGGPRYEAVSVLITAAFYAAKLEHPKWVERLAIEMFSKRNRRKSWDRKNLDFRGRPLETK